MRVMENGVYRDATAEEIAARAEQEEPVVEPSIEERLAALEALFAEKEVK